MEKYYVTRKGYDKLCDEIAMQDTLYIDIERELGKSAKRDNDLRENSEYMELRVKAMYDIPAKKAELQKKLQSAVIIEETPEYINWDGETVIRKCNVTIDYDGEVETYTVLGANESNVVENILSCECSLVLAILGKKVGQSVQFNESQIKILSVKKIENTKSLKINKKI